MWDGFFSFLSEKSRDNNTQIEALKIEDDDRTAFAESEDGQWTDEACRQKNYGEHAHAHSNEWIGRGRDRDTRNPRKETLKKVRGEEGTLLHMLERNSEWQWTYATEAAMIRAGFRSCPTAMRLLCCQNVLLKIPPVLGNTCSPWSYTQQLHHQHEGGHRSSSSSLWGDEDLRLKIFATKMMSWVSFQADPKLQCSHSFSFRRVLRVIFCCFSTHKILLRQYLLFMRISIIGNLSFLLPFLQHIFRAFVNFMLVILFEFHSLFSLQNWLRRIWQHNFMDSIRDLKARITFMYWWSVKMLENCRKHEKWDM